MNVLNIGFWFILIVIGRLKVTTDNNSTKKNEKLISKLFIDVVQKLTDRFLNNFFFNLSLPLITNK